MRRSKLSIGRDAEGADCWRIDTFWAFLGYSVHAWCLAASKSAGIGYLQWYYHTERDEGTTYSP